MSLHVKGTGRVSKYMLMLKQALRGDEMDYTRGSIRKAVIMLAIPMMLEVSLESVFALVDLYFVGHLRHSSNAIQTVGLTESVLLLLYSISIGMSTAATAIVARRAGEKNYEAAGLCGIQAILVASAFTVILSIVGVIKTRGILLLMGASENTIATGAAFTQIAIGSSGVVMLLFLINGIFRGAGNAAIAMKSLWIANICNIVLCPMLINGFWIVPAYGLAGAAMATALARGIGVLYQVYYLFYGNHQLKIKASNFIPRFKIIKSLIAVALPGVFQFIIASCSWVFLAQLVATTGGDEGSAGYQTALRLMEFFMLPAWGLSNAACTMAGQNLGAKNAGRAEDSVMETAVYNIVFMLCVTLLFFFLSGWMVSFFTSDVKITAVAGKALHIMSAGFVFYGVGMVMMNAFNGAGDTRTPTRVAFVGFWLFQIPLAYVLARYLNMGPEGVFIAIPVSETAITIALFILFKKGKWKNVSV